MYQHTSQTNQDFAHLITGIMQQQFPGMDRFGLDTLLIANGLGRSHQPLPRKWVPTNAARRWTRCCATRWRFTRLCIEHARRISKPPPPPGNSN